jgi:hypothetical protein
MHHFEAATLTVQQTSNIHEIEVLPKRGLTFFTALFNSVNKIMSEILSRQLHAGHPISNAISDAGKC